MIYSQSSTSSCFAFPWTPIVSSLALALISLLLPLSLPLCPALPDLPSLCAYHHSVDIRSSETVFIISRTHMRILVLCALLLGLSTVAPLASATASAVEANSASELDLDLESNLDIDLDLATEDSPASSYDPRRLASLDLDLYDAKSYAALEFRDPGPVPQRFAKAASLLDMDARTAIEADIDLSSYSSDDVALRTEHLSASQQALLASHEAESRADSRLESLLDSGLDADADMDADALWAQATNAALIENPSVTTPAPAAEAADGTVVDATAAAEAAAAGAAAEGTPGDADAAAAGGMVLGPLPTLDAANAANAASGAIPEDGGAGAPAVMSTDSATTESANSVAAVAGTSAVPVAPTMPGTEPAATGVNPTTTTATSVTPGAAAAPAADPANEKPKVPKFAVSTSKVLASGPPKAGEGLRSWNVSPDTQAGRNLTLPERLSNVRKQLDEDKDAPMYHHMDRVLKRVNTIADSFDKLDKDVKANNFARVHSNPHSHRTKGDKEITGEDPVAPRSKDVIDCVACRYAWMQVEVDLGNSVDPVALYDAFVTHCSEMQLSNIFKHPCNNMFAMIDKMIGDYVASMSVNQMCMHAAMCR